MWENDPIVLDLMNYLIKKGCNISTPSSSGMDCLTIFYSYLDGRSAGVQVEGE